MPERRFPPPWSVEETGACFIVRDHNGQQLAYVYFEDEPSRQSVAKLLSKGEARRVAANVAKPKRRRVLRQSVAFARARHQEQLDASPFERQRSDGLPLAFPTVE
jgi:hypothetical protein